MSYRPGVRVGTRLPRRQLWNDAVRILELRAEGKGHDEISAIIGRSRKNCDRRVNWYRRVLATMPAAAVPPLRARANWHPVYTDLPFLPNEGSPSYRVQREAGFGVLGSAPRNWPTQDGDAELLYEARCVGELSCDEEVVEEAIGQAERELEITRKLARADELRAELAQAQLERHKRAEP
jgi:hypothetical protein